MENRGKLQKAHAQGWLYSRKDGASQLSYMLKVMTSFLLYHVMTSFLLDVMTFFLLYNAMYPTSIMICCLARQCCPRLLPLWRDVVVIQPVRIRVDPWVPGGHCVHCTQCTWWSPRWRHWTSVAVQLVNSAVMTNILGDRLCAHEGQNLPRR